MSICKRCGKQYSRKDVGDGKIAFEFSKVSVISKHGDYDGRQKVDYILSLVGKERAKFCPECTDDYILWMTHPGTCGEIGNLEIENKDLCDTVDILNDRIDLLNSVCEKEREQFKKKVKERETEINALEDALHDLECEKNELQKTVHNLRHRIGDLEDDNALRERMYDEIRSCDPEIAKKFIVDVAKLAIYGKDGE